MFSTKEGVRGTQGWQSRPGGCDLRRRGRSEQSRRNLQSGSGSEFRGTRGFAGNGVLGPSTVIGAGVRGYTDGEINHCVRKHTRVFPGLEVVDVNTLGDFRQAPQEGERACDAEVDAL
jgi:hypothetical protein